MLTASTITFIGRRSSFFCKLMIVAAAFLPHAGEARSSEILLVGLKKSQVQSVTQMASILGNLAFIHSPTGGCTTRAKVIRMDEPTPSSLFPNNGFSEPVVLIVQVKVEALENTFERGCDPTTEDCNALRPVVKVCTTPEEQAAAKASAIKLFWESNPAIEVREILVTPVPGVRIGN